MKAGSFEVQLWTLLVCPVDCRCTRNRVGDARGGALLKMSCSGNNSDLDIVAAEDQKR